MPTNRRNLFVIGEAPRTSGMACVMQIFCQSRLESGDCWTWNQSKNTEASFEAPEASEEDPRLNEENPRLGGASGLIGGKKGSPNPKQHNEKRHTEQHKQDTYSQDPSWDWSQRGCQIRRKCIQLKPQKHPKSAPSGRPVSPPNSIGK